jgi:hypothetical protein
MGAGKGEGKRLPRFNNIHSRKLVTNTYKREEI